MSVPDSVCTPPPVFLHAGSKEVEVPSADVRPVLMSDADKQAVKTMTKGAYIGATVAVRV